MPCVWTRQIGIIAMLASMSVLQADILLKESFVSSDGYSESAGGSGNLKAQSLSGPEGFELGDAVWTGSTSLMCYSDAFNLSAPSLHFSAGGGVGLSLINPTSRSLIRAHEDISFNDSTPAFYMSFLINLGSVDPTGIAYVSVANNAIGNNFAYGLGAGVKDGRFMLINRDPVGQNKSLYIDLGTEYTKGTHLIIIKLDSGADGLWDEGFDQVTVWIDPQDTTTEASATLRNTTHFSIESSSGAGAYPMNELTLYTADFSTVTEAIFDEIRVGTTWEDVTDGAGTSSIKTDIPEPTAYALIFGGASLSFAMRKGVWFR